METDALDNLLNSDALEEARKVATQIADDLECAGTVETADDFYGNVLGALCQATDLVKRLEKLHAKAKRVAGR